VHARERARALLGFGACRFRGRVAGSIGAGNRERENDGSDAKETAVPGPGTDATKPESLVLGISIGVPSAARGRRSPTPWLRRVA